MNLKSPTTATTPPKPLYPSVLIMWLLFSIVYLFAAWHKPFHVDEFYSWMYTWRCSFGDILLLRDFGIGHPPLYHLLQKFVQLCMPFYHPLFIRAANYVIGSIFVIVFTSWCLRQKRVPLFCAGVCLSATVLEAFVFSRMWGLVFLSVFLLYLTGERYLRTGALGDLVRLGGACLFALAADYGSMIVVLPYTAFMMAVRLQARYARRLAALSVTALALGWLITTWKDMSGAGLFAYAGRLAGDLSMVVSKSLNVLFNFWFVEPFALAVLVFGGVLVIEVILRGKRTVAPGALNAPATEGRLAGRLIKQAQSLLDVRGESGRLVLTILSAWIMLLAVSPVFWRELLNKKYLMIILPLALIFLLKNLRPRLLNTLALVLLSSGGIYLFSNQMVEWYLPQAFDVSHPVIFENEFACANHYLRRGFGSGEEPVLVDFKMFEINCKRCRIGTDVFDAGGVDTLQFVGFERPEPELAKVFTPPPGFILIRTEEVRMRWLDRIQFRLLTPIPKHRFLVYTYIRAPEPAD